MKTSISSTIFEGLCQAYGGSSQFGPQAMLEALQGQLRNGLMNPTSADHSIEKAKQVWQDLLDLYYQGHDDLETIKTQNVKDGFEILNSMGLTK